MSSMLVEEVAPSSAAALSEVPPRRFAEATWLAPLVLVAATVLSIYVYVGFLGNSRSLWWWIMHDRHTHYMNGLTLALDLRTGDFARVWHDFDRMRVWGPFNVVMVALAEIVAGPNYRLAVLPSLAGWIMTMWFAFLIPRRLLPEGGNAAGMLAAFFVALSPAHRAYATDVMYESLGAGLSLAAIYCYLVAVQDATRRSGILLGVVLTCLFLHKYNYWFLVVFGLFFGECARQPRACLRFAWALCRRDRLPRWLAAECKQPLDYLMLAFAAAALAVALTGGLTLTLAGRTVSIQEPHNLIHLAYLAFFVRLVLWWRQTGQVWSRDFPPALRSLLLCHGGALAVWFLLPKRLSYFLWYLSPANNDQPRDSVPFMHGGPFYLQGFQDDYLTRSWEIYLFAAMLLLALASWRALKPGSAMLFVFFLIATYLTCQHPMLKNRFLHSWIAVGWVLGAVGLVHAVQRGAGWIGERARPWAAGGVCALLVALFCPALPEQGHAQEGGLSTRYPSPLVIPETYLPFLADAKEPTIFCNVSTRFLLTWTFIEYHRHQRFTADLKNYKANFEDNPGQIRHWLGKTPSDALVLIEVHPGSPFDFASIENVNLSALQRELAQQTAFALTRRWELPEGITITLWKKNAS